MNIYLSGPISGRENRNLKTFLIEAQRLKMLGFNVRIPHLIFQGRNTGAYTWEQYMKECIPAMLKCDMVATLPDWHESKGACIEVDLARKLNIPVKLCSIINKSDYEAHHQQDAQSRA